MYNCLLQLFNQDYDLASHNNHAVCVNFIYERRNLKFNLKFYRFCWNLASHITYVVCINLTLKTSVLAY